MSHNATNWAIQQRGLKPATKIVLWHLCDRHNPDKGCFPSQENLARDCEMSRSSLNNHLRELEERKLIRRERHVDERTKRQQPTRYFLAFEISESRVQNLDPANEAVSKSEAEPCPKISESRVQNLDTNPVREPVIEPAAAAREKSDLEAMTDRLLEAVNDKIQPHAAVNLSSIIGLIEAGADLDTDILPTIRLVASRLKRPAGSWAYFVPAIRDAYETRLSAGKGLSQTHIGKPPGSMMVVDGEWVPTTERRWKTRLQMAREQRQWSRSEFGPAPGEPGCIVPQHLIQPGDGEDWREWENAA